MQPSSLALLLLAGCLRASQAAVISAVAAGPSHVYGAQVLGGTNNLTVAAAFVQKAVTVQPDDDPLHASNYKEETTIFSSVSVECIFAGLFCCLVGSVPIVLVALVGPEGGLTPAHKVESALLICWLVAVIALFTTTLEFQSGAGHWQGARPLTIVEAVYLLAQILTTVGYGDITPAYPLSQVLVAVNVILALCLYGSLIMETADLVSARAQRAWEEYTKKQEDEIGSPTHTARLTEAANKSLKDWKAGSSLNVDTSQLKKFAVAFGTMILIGVLFWHFYPGEEKTWLQAVYFSIITLSTVGFGAITAVTPGGMVFGAFWMLFGVATLGGIITSFVDVMVQMKALERVNPDKEKIQFYKYVKDCSHSVKALESSEKDQIGMDRYDFLKFGLMLNGLATEEEVRFIEERFAHLGPDADGNISLDKLYRGGEGPPGWTVEALADK